jgi:hypothetical protein
MYCYIWEYTVPIEHLDVFEAGYGPDGEWVRLFRRDPDYIRTELFRDRDWLGRFITLDFWSSREACMGFRERFRSEFDALDAQFDRLTHRELHLGDFDVIATRHETGRAPPPS